MKTTLELPDELMRAIKLRAVREDRKLKDLIAELLRRGLASDERGARGARRHVSLPLVLCAHQADPGAEMTPDRVAAALIDEETDGAVLR